ncbi:MAG: hypothetical protein WCX16_05470 [Candidatus Omnitrophota bacterium]|jgi:hypothetical protein
MNAWVIRRSQKHFSEGGCGSGPGQNYLPVPKKCLVRFFVFSDIKVLMMDLLVESVQERLSRQDVF